MNGQGAGQTVSGGNREISSARLSLSERSSKLVFYIPLLTAVTTLMLVVFAVYGGWFGKSAHIGTGFGEISRPGFIKQPVNTFSSLGFVLTGLAIGWCIMRRSCVQHPTLFTRETFVSALFPSLVVCLGPGSMAMHATETQWGGHLDMLAMYFFVGFLVAYAFQRFLRFTRLWFVLLFAAVVVVCLYVDNLHYSMPFMRDFGDFIFGLCILFAAVIEGLNVYVRKMNHDVRWGALTLSLLLLAFLIWKLSLTRTPSYSLVQGHGVWHVLCAVSAYCLFRYYVSEKPPARQVALASVGSEFTSCS